MCVCVCVCVCVYTYILVILEASHCSNRFCHIPWSIFFFVFSFCLDVQVL